MKKMVGIVVALVVLVGAIWYVVSAGWFSSPEIPNNPPTADELERLREIDELSSQIAPDATPGAGVFAPGTLPAPVPEPELVATNTPPVEVAE